MGINKFNQNTPILNHAGAYFHFKTPILQNKSQDIFSTVLRLELFLKTKWKGTMT